MPGLPPRVVHESARAEATAGRHPKSATTHSKPSSTIRGHAPSQHVTSARGSYPASMAPLDSDYQALGEGSPTAGNRGARPGVVEESAVGGGAGRGSIQLLAHDGGTRAPAGQESTLPVPSMKSLPPSALQHILDSSNQASNTHPRAPIQLSSIARAAASAEAAGPEASSTSGPGSASTAAASSTSALQASQHRGAALHMASPSGTPCNAGETSPLRGIIRQSGSEPSAGASGYPAHARAAAPMPGFATPPRPSTSGRAAAPSPGSHSKFSHLTAGDSAGESRQLVILVHKLQAAPGETVLGQIAEAADVFSTAAWLCSGNQVSGLALHRW